MPSRHDLAADRRHRVVVTEDPALDLAHGFDPVLDDRLPLEADRALEPAAELVGREHLADAYRGAERRRLREERKTERERACDHTLRAITPLRLGTRTGAHHRQPGGSPQRLLHAFVHPERAPEDARPDV